jgi:hypothetical protein
MSISTKAKCEAYAARHFLTVEVRKMYYLSYSVDLPEGLITESGHTGLAGEDDCGEVRMPQMWGAIMQDMETLVSEKWVLDADWVEWE